MSIDAATILVHLWLATLWLPGHSALIRLFPEVLQWGWFGRIGLAYLLSLALLAPFVIVGYPLHVPVGLLAGVHFVFLALAVGDHTLNRRWHLVFQGARWIHLAPVALVVLELAYSGYAGTTLLGDSPIHLARSRWLQAYGLGFADPYVSAPTPMPTAHVQLHHVLVAVIAKLGHVDVLFAWKSFLWMSRLLVYSAVYLAAARLFRSKWAAWTAVAFCVGATAPITFMSYPSKLSAYWLLPLQFAFTVELFRGTLSLRCVSWFLALTSLILGVFHPLYVAFGALSFGGATLVWALRRPDSTWASLWPTVSLSIGLPFFAISALMPRFERPIPGFEQLTVQVGNSFSVISPMFAWGADGLKEAITALPLLVVVVIFFSCIRHTRQSGLLTLGLVAVIANLQFNPLIATPILRLLELDYLLFRLGGLLVVCSLLFLGGSVGFVVESLGVLTAGRRRYIAAAACVLACAFLGDMWDRQHLYEANWRRDYFSYLTGAARPWPSYSNLDELRALLSEHVAVGSVVLTPARLANYLPAAHAV